MLVVKTYVDRSAVNGFGVFAGEDIPAHALLWEFTPYFDLELEAERFSGQAQQYILHYGNMIEPGLFLLCGDNARFMNHSENPNMTAVDGKNYALRNIAAGEEITCDYREFDIAFKGFSS